MKFILKRNNYQVLAAILLISVMVNSCTNTTDYYDRSYARNWLKLNGKVKSVGYSVFNVSDSLILYKSYRFDKFGRLIEEYEKSNGDEVHKVAKLGKPNKLTDLSMHITSVKELSESKNGYLISRIMSKNSFDTYKRLVNQLEIHDGKKIKSTKLDYTEVGDLYSARTFNHQNGERMIEIFSYDENNVLTEKMFTRINKDSIQIRKGITKFDARGNIKSTLDYFEGDIPHHKKTYTYDSSGNIIAYKSYGTDSLVYNEGFINYNTSGFKTDSIHQSYWWTSRKPNNLELFQKEVYIFNEDEKIKEIIITKRDSLVEKTTYIYNQDKTLNMCIISYDAGKTIHKYDKMNQKILTKVFDINDSLLKEEIIAAKYDSHKNRIKIKRVENDSLIENIRVKIDYY